MQILPLVLGAKRGAWRCHDDDAGLANESFDAVRPQVLRRDKHTCRFCGFHVRVGDKDVGGYLHVHHLNDDHHDNRLENLVTACPFCHQVFHCGNAGHRGAARVIFCPWLSQTEINWLANVCAVAMSRDGEYAALGERVMDDLASLGALAEERLGPGAEDAAILGSALMSLWHRNREAYARRGEILAGIRLLPEPGMHDKAVRFWSEYAWLPEINWMDVYKTLNLPEEGP